MEKEVKKPAPRKSKSGDLLYDKDQKLDRLVEIYTDLYATDNLVSKMTLEEIPQIAPLSDLDVEPPSKILTKLLTTLTVAKHLAKTAYPQRLSRTVRRY